MHNWSHIAIIKNRSLILTHLVFKFWRPFRLVAAARAQDSENWGHSCQVQQGGPDYLDVTRGSHEVEEHCPFQGNPNHTTTSQRTQSAGPKWGLQKWDPKGLGTSDLDNEAWQGTGLYYLQGSTRVPWNLCAEGQTPGAGLGRGFGTRGPNIGVQWPTVQFSGRWKCCIFVEFTPYIFCLGWCIYHGQAYVLKGLFDDLICPVLIKNQIY